MIPGSICLYDLMPLIFDEDEEGIPRQAYLIFTRQSSRNTILIGLAARATRKKRRALAFNNEIKPLL